MEETASAPEHDLFRGVVPFVVAAELRSVRGAARRLGQTASAVSKAIARLEASLGVRLLDRSARAVRLTVEGEAIFAQLREAVARALAARELARGAAERARGRVRISAPRVLGRGLLAPALPRLLERYPELEIELTLTDRYVGLASEDVDVALRLGAPGGAGGVIARRLATTRWATVASPAYVARRGAPRTVADLAGHACLRFLGPAGKPRDWELAPRRGARGAVAPVRGRLVADDGDALIAAAIGGAGIVQAVDLMVQAPLADGRLVEVLAELAVDGPPLYALAAPHRARLPRVRAVLDLLVSVCR